MTARAENSIPHSDLRALGERLRRLADFADAGGAPRDWLEATIAELLATLIELTERRDGLNDRRRRQALALGEKIAKARQAGASIEELSIGFGRSKSSVHRLLTEVSRHHERVFCLDAPRQNAKREEAAK